MSSTAGISQGHAITAQQTPPTPIPPFVPGDPLFNVVVTAVPYQALVGDFVLTTDTSVTTPVAPADGAYFAVKNMGTIPVAIVGTVDGSVAYTIHPSTTPAAKESVWFVWSSVSASWEIVSDYDTVFPFTIDSVAGAVYNFALTDANVRVKSFTNVAAKAATVLNEATVGWKAGTVLRLLNFGTLGVAGAMSVVAGAGVTIQTPQTLVATGIYKQMQLLYLGGDVWVLSGELDPILGQPLFNIVVTAVPYQALVGDFVLTTGASVTTPVAPVSGAYFAVKNMGVATVSIVGTVDGSITFTIPPPTTTAPSSKDSVWFVWSATSASWEVVSDYGLSDPSWSPKRLIPNSQAGVTYALVQGDEDTGVETTSAVAVSITVPVLAIGTQIPIMQAGAGQITCVASGTTLRTPLGAKSLQQYTSIILWWRTTTEVWVLGTTAV